jgi:hypothetical protein
MSGKVAVRCRVGQYPGMGDPYLDGTSCWWHLPGPSPELLAAVPNDIGPAVIERVFRGWRIDQMTAEDIPAGTRSMPAMVVRLHRA